MSESSRDAILSRLRAAVPEPLPLPSLDDMSRWQTFEDPAAQFESVLASVGGTYFRVGSVADAHRELTQLAAWQDAKVTVSHVSGVGSSSLDEDQISDPHDLENIDFAVLNGHIAVAENGAVWVTDAHTPHRVIYFIPQHVALVVPANGLVHNMHEAYQHITPADHTFGAFISGPSKTADIEQSLVIGAHGARSLSVFLVDDLDR